MLENITAGDLSPAVYFNFVIIVLNFSVENNWIKKIQCNETGDFLGFSKFTGS